MHYDHILRCNSTTTCGRGVQYVKYYNVLINLINQLQASACSWGGIELPTLWLVDNSELLSWQAGANSKDKLPALGVQWCCQGQTLPHILQNSTPDTFGQCHRHTIYRYIQSTNTQPHNFLWQHKGGWINEKLAAQSSHRFADYSLRGSMTSRLLK